MKLSSLLLALILLAIPALPSARAAAPKGQTKTRSQAKTLAKAGRPNILYFYVDDMGWGSIGPNGQAARKAKNLPYVRTPNIDRLAAAGINFTRGYGCHVCSPARSSQQTGFHQGHTFADRNDPNNAKKAMRADDMTMGDALSSAGYVTGYWGKWGYGGSKDKVKPVIDNIQTLPTSHGYKYVLAELHHVRAHTFFQPTLWSAPAPGNAPRTAIGALKLIPNSMVPYRNRRYPNTPALQNHANYPRTAYCDDSYAFAALDFVRTQARNYNKTGQPFFGLLAVQIPHAPFDEIAKLPNWNQAYADDPHFAGLAKQSQQWAAMVTRIDAHFGNILAALEDPNGDGNKSDSVANNTLVIFQSDNGGPGGKSNVELDANGGLSGTKGKIQEGGIRVPLVMRWPAKINNTSKLKAGTNFNMVVDVTDLLPTFCELAGVAAPLGIDGVSIAPTLRGTGHQRHREFIIHEAGNGQSIIRGKYKLVRSKTSLSLYDLDADPAETKNLLGTGSSKATGKNTGKGAKKGKRKKKAGKALAPTPAKSPTKLTGKYGQLAKELEALLLGERVAEPRGFANTYHHWTGKDGAATSDAANWSDYKYANAGVTYMTDAGAPQLSWTARIENKGVRPSIARADKDLEFLALEIAGNTKSKRAQSLVLGPKINLTGRNEIRIAAHGALTIDGGTVSSLRWIDIQSGATLNGHGTIDATVYNNGTLNLTLNNNEKPTLTITGQAQLAGTLKVTFPKGFKPASGRTYTVLSAAGITGTFANPNNQVVAPDGSCFMIRYAESTVTLTLK